MGIWCPELELSDESLVAKAEPDPSHGSVRALVRTRGEVLGYVQIDRPPAEVTAADLAAAARLQFSAATIAAASAAADRPVQAGSDAQRPLVSVIVCTRNRSAILPGCLRALAAISYDNLEIIVVDNAPDDDSTLDVVAAADPRIVYAREPRAGLSRARNCGLALARGTIVAYTDDDVWVDADWITQLVRGFAAAPGVACVTGPVCSASLTTAAEMYFDARVGSWSSRWEGRTFDLDANRLPDPLYPYSTGVFGTGANFAFDRRVLVELGEFDEALGAGTATRGGEDLDMFLRILRAGHSVRYEPSAIAWHYHRSDPAALLDQMYGYGTGLTAYLTKLLLQRGTAGEVLRRTPLGVLRITRIRRGTKQRLSVPAPFGALLSEYRGYAYGPFLYLRSRRALRSEKSGIA